MNFKKIYTEASDVKYELAPGAFEKRLSLSLEEFEALRDAFPKIVEMFFEVKEKDKERVQKITA